MKRPEFKYKVKDLAEKLDLEPVSVRVRLRNKRIPKYRGRFYGWQTKEQFNRVLKAIS